jgi:CubicO group peptidase (beta-lactamase class C family)
MRRDGRRLRLGRRTGALECTDPGEALVACPSAELCRSIEAAAGRRSGEPDSAGPSDRLHSLVMGELVDHVDRIVLQTAFSGVVRIDRGAETVAKAYGHADRAHEIANTVDTVFGLASGAKGLTALTVMSLVEDDLLALSTTARSVLGEDLPLIDDAVTVENLLAHWSGIGDYFDEELERPITDHVLSVPVHALNSIEAHVPALDGYPMKFRPGERFSYCNSGYVVLALIAERVSGTPFHDLVVERVCRPAGMSHTRFLRSDELPGEAAMGYLYDEGLRSNILHLPVRGAGDGGIYSTGADISALWTAMFEGRIVTKDRVAEMTRPHSDAPEHSSPYGWGFWLHPTRPIVELRGYDAGISFRSVHDPTDGYTATVISNTSEGAWPVTEQLDDLVFGEASRPPSNDAIPP